MEIYFIRHGQSSNNATDEANRIPEPPLTELGNLQSNLLAEHLFQKNPNGNSISINDTYNKNGYFFDRIFCSPMYRALQTAKPIANKLGLKIEIWADLHEIGGVYLGSGRKLYSGLTKNQIREEFPEYIIPSSISEKGWWNRSREKPLATRIRVKRVLSVIKRNFRNKLSIALITHSGFLDLLLKEMFSVRKKTGFRIEVCNTGITRLDIDPKGNPILRYINKAEHLSSTTISWGNY